MNSLVLAPIVICEEAFDSVTQAHETFQRAVKVFGFDDVAYKSKGLIYKTASIQCDELELLAIGEDPAPFLRMEREYV